MSLGMEVGRAPGHVVLDEDPAPSCPERGTSAPPPLFFLNDSLLLSSLVGNIHYMVIPPAGVRSVKVFGKKLVF